MLKNYLKIALRNGLKNKLWSSINILSLAFGIAACLLIYLFIQDERSFDGIHDKQDNIYRLCEIQSFPGTNTQKVALSMPGMGPAIQRDYPDIEQYTRFYGRGRSVFTYNALQILVEKSVAVDSNFLQVFDFPLLEGDRETALHAPNSIVLTKETARKFFGENTALGKSITREDQTYEVTGVIETPLETSHLQFDLLFSMSTIISEFAEFNSQFGSNYLVTYLVMKDDVNIAALESKMPEFLLRCMPPDPEQTGDVTDAYKLFFQKLPDVHLASMDIEHDYHNHRKFNGSYLGLFSLVGILILLIAALNFMNLITARASHRWKEVGVRKTVGAMKSQMFKQFSVEAALLGAFAFVGGILLTLAFTPVLNSLLDRELSFMYFLDHPTLLLATFGITLLLSFLAGIYPSYYLSSFSTVKILQGANLESNRSIFRSTLVVLQFGLAIGMIISTLIVVQQLYYINNKDIGLNKDHIVLLPLNSQANEQYSALKEEMKRSTHVLGATGSGQRLGNNFHQWGFKLRTDSVRNLTPSNVNVDFDYLDVYEMNMVAGRTFSRDRPTDNGLAFIINESFAKELQLEDPIGVSAGHAWYPDDSLGTIIGVVRDFNFNSLHYAINTLSLVVHSEWTFDEMSLKIDGNNIPAALADIEKTWNRLVPNWPFQYSFLDEHFQEMYESDSQMKAVVSIMAGLAILIACMGLFGLAAITTEKKIKEVGIRKVLGASVQNIMYHLSKSFGRMVIVAFVIFSPITYYLMTHWLENFADRITISPVIFIVGFVLAFVIAILTVSVHTGRAALGNPVRALRDD